MIHHQSFNRYILVILLVLAIVNCDNKQEKHAKEGEKQGSTAVTFDLKNLKKTSDVKLSDLEVVGIKYIPLETNPNFMVGEIYELKADARQLIIDGGQGLLNFSYDGSYVAQIGRKGKGEGEYQFCKDFSVDKNDRVYILSMHEDKIYIYSPEGKFIRTIPCPKTSTKLCCMDSNILCFSENAGGFVINSFDIINYDGKILKSFPNKFKFKVGRNPGLLMNECASFRSEGQLYIKEVSSDTVFVYKDMDLNPAFILDDGGNQCLLRRGIGTVLKNLKKQLWNIYPFGNY